MRYLYLCVDKKKEIMRIPFTGNTHNRQTTAKKHAAKSILPNRKHMGKLLVTLLSCASLFPLKGMAGSAAGTPDSLTIDSTLTLREYTVKGTRVIQKADRTLFLPTKKMARSSDNGYDLLKLVKLPGIKVDPVQQKIESLRGGGVQIRINDVVANTQDILALQPDEVIRVEYIENPGVRYSDTSLDAVINYVVKRRYSGYVGGAQTMQAFTTGFNNSSAYFKFNHKKSEFSFSYSFNWRDYDQRRYDETADYYFPDGTVRHREYRGYDTPFMYNTHYFQLGYNLAEPDKYTFNARFNLAVSNNPYRGVNQLAMETGQPDLYLYNKASVNDNTPSIDLYFSSKLGHGQSLTANVVGTYIHTKNKYLMRQYMFDQSPEQSMLASPVDDYSYSTLGNKYSLIAEAIYAKEFKNHVLSAGGEFTISRTDNDYTGTVDTDALLNSNNLYLFTQLQGKLAWLNYMVGVGANRASTHQGDIGFEKWTFRPMLSLQTSVIKNVSLSLEGEADQRTPSLAQLSDVRQQSNDMMADDGNVNLKPYASYSAYFVCTWDLPLFSWWINGGVAYAPDIIMSSYIPEQQTDGSYLIVSRPENQRNLIQKWARTSFTLHAIKDVLDLGLYGAFQRYDSRGLTYRHTFNSWRWGAEANLMLGNWTVMADFYNTPKSFYGESMSGGENSSDLRVTYKWKDLRLGLGAILVGYPQGYEYPGYTDSRYYKSHFKTWIKDNGNMLYVTLSYTFSHGRKYKAEQRKLNNADYDSGIK